MAKRKANNPYYKHMPTISARRIIHHICDFVLTLLIFLMAGSLSAVIGFLNESALRSAIENQEFYAEVRKNIISQCQSIAIPSMIDEDVFYEIFTQEKIASDIKAYVSAGVEGKNYSFDLESLKKTTNDKINAYFEEEKTPITAQLKADIQTFTEKVMNIYQTGISISYIDSYAQIKGTAKPIAIILFVVCLVLTIALLFFMIAIYRFKVIHKTIRMLAYALGGAGMMLSGLFGYCKYFYIGSGLQIIPKFLYDAMHRFIQHGLTTFIFAGVLLMIFALGLAFVSESLRSRVKKNYFARLEANFRENLNDELETKNFTPDLDMTNREEAAKRVAHDEFNRYAKDRLDNVTLNEENERIDNKEFDLPIVNPPAHDDFTEVRVDEDKDE